MMRAVSLTFFGTYKGHGHPHESPKIMTYPLVALAFFSVVIGWINIPGVTEFHTKGVSALFYAITEHHATGINYASRRPRHPGGRSVVSSSATSSGSPTRKPSRNGTGSASRCFTRCSSTSTTSTTSTWTASSGRSAARWPRGVDWFNGHVIDLVVNGAGFLATRLARLVYWFDQRGVDGAINASAAAAGGSGGLLRLLQTGRVQQYAFFIVTGIVRPRRRIHHLLIGGNEYT